MHFCPESVIDYVQTKAVEKMLYLLCSPVVEFLDICLRKFVLEIYPVATVRL